MNVVTRRIWDRGLNLKKWSDLNGFKYRYVVLVLGNIRGSQNVGVAKKIKDSLVNQGFATADDFDQREM